MAPNEIVAQIQAAIAHQRSGRPAQAEQIYKRLLKKAPDNFDCSYLLATLYAEQGRLKQAIEMFRRAGKIRPELVEVQYNLAVALGIAGDDAEAARIYERILDVDPQNAAARNNYAASLLSRGHAVDALQQYDRLIAQHPGAADAYNNRGMALHYLKRFDEALAAYDRAIGLRPQFAEAYVNRGNVLATLRRTDDALASFTKATALKPDFADAYSNAGNIHCDRKAYGEAIRTFDCALALRPDDAETKSMRLYAKMHLCDWSGFAAESADLRASIDRGMPVYPFVALAVSTSPAQQFRCARQFAAKRYPRAPTPLWQGESYAHDRLRIAYLSADFRAHAVSNLMAGLFECHDRTQFEVTALSIGPDDGSTMRRRLQQAFDSFIDGTGLRDEEIAARIRAQEIDILIDLNGYTQGARVGILAQRAAPVTATYLGYAGSLGTDYVDYVIADRTVIPREHFPSYSEKPVWLPDCFMVNDASRAIAERVPARSELGLPDHGLVFCCFNQPYKISPAIFAIWMRLLNAVDGSVLWLKDSGAAATTNLRREAERLGVAPDRLVFAPAVPEAADHLARQQQADLFLDTAPYNAHATAADALWAGLPVLTSLGNTYASRVAASLVRSLDLAELVAPSLSDYEALALKLAREPQLLRSVKTKLVRNRDTGALFDTRRFTRNIEAAYRTMWQTARRGARPQSFAIDEVGRSTTLD